MNILVWDIPIRVFHWGFAFCSGGALAIALVADKDSAVFPFHMLLGISACFFLLLRLVLALVGCPHNRFRAMIFTPSETFRYFIGVVTGKASRYTVHNPGGSALTIGMFLLVPSLFASGLGWTGDSMEDIHEILAYALLVAIVAHLAGMAIHTFRHGENIAASMLTGVKQSSAEERLQSSRPVIGAIVLLVSVVWMTSLVFNYNANRRTVTLPLLGSSIQLGENDHNHHAHETDEDAD